MCVCVCVCVASEECERLASIEAVESKQGYEEHKLSIGAKIRRQDDLEIAMGTVFNPEDSMGDLLGNHTRAIPSAA